MATNLTYIQMLQQAKLDFFRRSAHLPEEQRQHLWQATLAQDVDAPSSLDTHVPRSMPSMSYNTPLPSQSSNLDINSTMDRTISAPPSVSMGRSMSSHGNHDSTIRRSSSAISSTWRSEDQPTDYTLCSQNGSNSMPGSLQSIGEANGCVEYSPSDYITFMHQSTSPPLPYSPSSADAARLDASQLTATTQWSPSSSDGSISPSSPPALLTPVTMSDGDMSRQSSLNPQMFENFPMLRVHSDSSAQMPILSEDGSQFSFFNADSNYGVCADNSISLPFTASGERFPSAHVFPSVSAFDPSQQQLDLAEDMTRSASSSSGACEGYASSSSSGSTRYSQRDREIKACASRKIAPRVTDHDETKSASSKIQMGQVKSEDSSSKNVAAITKQSSSYKRPSHPKLLCQFCPKRPEFRGTHELERHMARKHTERRKGFICVDNSKDGKFLANCKHCRNKKVYGADYNAAAHLRRTHFHPRPRGRKSKTAEKRGGIGGGDDPSMEFLRAGWIQEIEVEKEEYEENTASLGNAQDNNASGVDSDMVDYDAMNRSYSSQSSIDMPNLGMPASTTYMDLNAFSQAHDPSYSAMMSCSSFNDPSISTIEMFEFDAYENSTHV